MSSSSPGSGYTVEFEDRGAYLYAHVSGARDTVPISLAFWREVAEECRRRGFQKLLLVERFEIEASMIDVYEVAGQLPEIVRGLMVAFVDEDFDTYDVNRFGEDVAVNRGAYGRVFADQTAAGIWLTETTRGVAPPG